jgi:hypothetical protein
MSPFDHALVALLALAAPIAERFFFYPRLVRAAEARVRGARGRYYLAGAAFAWAFTLCVLGAWIVRSRPWSALGLAPQDPKAAALGFVLAVAYAAAGMRARRRVIGKPESLVRLRSRLASASALLPRTPSERLGFAGLSLTAGICEEILYRGYLPWYLGAWTAPWVAIGASCVLFGFAHVYLGFQHVVRTAIVGAALALVVVLSGSLLPAMFLHATMDLLAGDLAFRAFGGEPATSATGRRL